MQTFGNSTKIGYSLKSVLLLWQNEAKNRMIQQKFERIVVHCESHSVITKERKKEKTFLFFMNRINTCGVSKSLQGPNISMHFHMCLCLLRCIVISIILSFFPYFSLMFQTWMRYARSCLWFGDRDRSKRAQQLYDD